MNGTTIIEALHRYADALRVAGTDEAAGVAWRTFVDSMDADIRGVIDRDDYEWLEALSRHSFDVGYHTALRRATELVTRCLEDAA